MDSDILDSIENGDLKLVTSKDGNIYAQLRNSNGKFGKRLPIKKNLKNQKEWKMKIKKEAIVMAYKIDKDKCVGCGACVDTCPMGCISIGDDGKAEIDASICISCGSCRAVCPVEAPDEEQENLL